MIPLMKRPVMLIMLFQCFPRQTVALKATHRVGCRHLPQQHRLWPSSRYTTHQKASECIFYSTKHAPSRRGFGYSRSTRLFASSSPPPPPSTRTTTPSRTDEVNTKTPTAASIDIYYNPSTPINYILGQSSLIVLAIIVSLVAHTPNFGCGPNIQFTGAAFRQGLLCTLPLALMAALPDLLKLEDQFPALKSVTKATLRSVLSLLGGQWKLLPALVVCTMLGMAAGFGEEMLFRGLLQYELTNQLELPIAVAILISSLVFGALHAVTPLYASLAGVASVYFGWIYATNDFNLAVPIVCHAVYDIGALLYAHWTVSRMSAAEQEEVYMWEPFALSDEPE